MICSGYSSNNIARSQKESMTTQTLTDEELDGIRHQLQALQVEHRDLDQVISHLILNPPPDDLLILRIKKRKLALKDRILQLEGMLVPDIPA